MKPKSLYICYFGLREPLVQTQVLPYLREVQKGGVDVSILTFEPNPRERWTPAAIADQKEALAAEGIEWNHLTYHKRPSAPATVFDIVNGAFFIWRKLRREKIDILHARVHVPAVMAAVARKFVFRKRRPKLLFDVRGFFPEEYVDAGVWPANGSIYRVVKRVERWILRESDGFVVLTAKARDILFPESSLDGADKLGRPVALIPCCVDLKRFNAAGESSRVSVREELGIGNRPVVTYVGSFGGWYLTDPMADFFGAAKRRFPDLYILILTQSDPAAIETLLHARKIPDADFHITKVQPQEVPRYLCASDAAISFIKPCYSKLSSSPTKIAEYLIAGVPVISNSGVGDVAELITENGVGVVIDGFSETDYEKALDHLEALLQDDSIREQCEQVAKREFDLERVAGERYRSIYGRLLSDVRSKSL